MKLPSFLTGDSRSNCCERPVSYKPLPRSVGGCHRRVYTPTQRTNLAIPVLVGMARFFFVVIVLIGGFVFVAFTL